MSKTFNDLRETAEGIRTNQQPESNTSELVGRQLIDMIDKQESEQADRMKMLAEYNISTNHPYDGIENSQRYALETAIQKLPTVLRRQGVKITFMQKNYTWVTYLFTGSTAEAALDTTQWIVYDAAILHDLGDSKTNTISQEGITKAIEAAKTERNLSIEYPTGGVDANGNEGGD